jgi:hypothetical protein
MLCNFPQLPKRPFVLYLWSLASRFPQTFLYTVGKDIGTSENSRSSWDENVKKYCTMDRRLSHHQNFDINWDPIKTTSTHISIQNKQTPWPESASELYRQSDSRLSKKLVSTFADIRYQVVIVTDPYCRILGFLDWSRYFFVQVAPQLYSWGWVEPVPNPLLFRKSGSVGNRTRTSGSVARNFDQ